MLQKEVSSLHAYFLIFFAFFWTMEISFASVVLFIYSFVFVLARLGEGQCCKLSQRGQWVSSEPVTFFSEVGFPNRCNSVIFSRFYPLLCQFWMTSIIVFNPVCVRSGVGMFVSVCVSWLYLIWQVLCFGLSGIRLLSVSFIFFFILFFYSIVPLGFLPWEIQVVISGESPLLQSRATQPTMHAGCF